MGATTSYVFIENRSVRQLPLSEVRASAPCFLRSCIAVHVKPVLLEIAEVLVWPRFA